MRSLRTAWSLALVMITGLLALPAQAAACTHGGDEAVAMAATPAGDGYWLIRDDGRVFAFGNAPDLGSFPTEVGDYIEMARTPSGQGLWAVTDGPPGVGGHVNTLGDAPELGDFVSQEEDPEGTPNCRGLVATPTGQGLWGLGPNGGVVQLGDAPDLGNFPAEPGEYHALAGAPSGQGLWGVTLGGPGVGGHLHALGQAVDLGDFVSEDEGDPGGQCCRGLVATPTGEGLWAVNLRGQLQTLGDASHLGNFVNDEGDPDPGSQCCRGLVATPTGAGLWGFTANGRVRTLGDAGFFGDLQGYAHPKGASPLRVSLVPAYAPCTASNRMHGPPLAHPSCSPPAQASGFLTVGTPDANGRPAKSVGSLRLGVIVGNPATPQNEADYLITHAFSDVRNQGDLSDYAGQLQVILSARVTDKLNGPSATEAATVSDLSFPVTVPCAPTPGTEGSACSLTTSANTVLPGAVTERKRAIWALDRVAVYDGGPDGSAATTGDNTLFATQGVFVP